MNTKIVDVKEYTNDQVGLLIQSVLVEMLIIFGIINLFTDIFMPVFYVIIVMILLVMAYNNVKTYKKKYMTPIYIIVAIFVAITTILEYIK